MTGIFIEGVDTTERTRNLQALRCNEHRVEALMSASSDAFYSLSADWSVMRQLSGKRLVSPIGQENPNWLADYIHPDERPAVQARVEEVVRSRTAIELEHQVHTADGGWAWTLSRVVPLLDKNGAVSEWFGSATDVTPLHDALEELQRLNGSLEAVMDLRRVERPA
ncbi:PAS domain-containing protein [Teichococcus aerofrigidensis]